MHFNHSYGNFIFLLQTEKGTFVAVGVRINLGFFIDGTKILVTHVNTLVLINILLINEVLLLLKIFFVARLMIFYYIFSFQSR